MKENGYIIWALEKTSMSQSIFNFEISESSQPTILVVGNEITGVDPDVLKLCDAHLHIPMVGLKNSLNVAIAFGIAVYSLTENQFSSSKSLKV
jgi:tRNA G18 (ribose-2'-O)-methylase SpoU